KLAQIMPFEQVLLILKEEALKSYGHNSIKVVEKNIQAIDKTLELLHQVPLPAEWRSLQVQPRKRSENVSDFLEEIV
ncbi:hypothetical protein ACQ1ZI_19370, partial [Enterococcus faecalis]|uniref:hypothetical protein n=1 Tax=Enterococcus faecalis TaxID=1351 RepID=UPI003D6C24C1